MKQSDYDRVKAEGGPYDDIIQNEAQATGVPYPLLHKQLFLESSFNPNAVSPTGPRGLAQMTKATGAAYGLLTDADFFDPTKAIAAAARHMQDNIKLAGGDQLKALLIYNQGAGPVGRKQLQAYDQGDLNGVSKEGLMYMRNLMDVTKEGSQASIESYAKPEGGSEAPTAVDPQASGAYAAPSYMVPASKASSMQPDGASGELDAPGAVPQRAKPFAQLLHETNAKEDGPGLFEGIGKTAQTGIGTSPLGVALRAAAGHDGFDFTDAFTRMRDVFNDPFQGGRMSDWTDEDYDKLRSSKLDPAYYDVVLRGYRRNFDQNLQLALDNQKMVEESHQAGFGAQLVGGVTGMAGDPWTLVGPGRGVATGLVGRMFGGAVAGGALGGASEYTSSKASGREADMGSAILGGALFGGLLNGAFGARPKAAAPGPEPLSGEWLGPEGHPDGPQHPGLESHIDGESWRTPLLEGHRSLPAPGDDCGAITRLLTREKARMQGAEVDPVSMPHLEDAPVHMGAPAPYSEVPFEPGTVRTPDGSVHSSGSPLNPKTVQDAIDLDPRDTKANLGMRWGNMSEIGLMLGRSEDDDIRALAHDLFRSPTGYTNGSNGKFGGTASDFVERFHAQDNRSYRNFAEILDEIHDDPKWKAQRGSKAARQESISRRVVEAMERGNTSSLTPGEAKLVKALQDHMGKKWSYIENPGQWGNMGAQSLLEESRHTGSYFPQRYSTAAKQGLIRLLGRDGLREAIKRSWLASYRARPEVKSRIDAHLAEAVDKELADSAPKPVKGKPAPAPDPKVREALLQKHVEDYAERKAHGISHTEQFNRSSLIEENLDDLTGLENNSYLEARNLFDSDMQIPLPDGSQFAVNDLRDFDIMRLVPQYDRRVNGDVAIMASTGKTTKEVKDLALSLGQKASRGAEVQESQALYDSLKMLTGRARRDPDTAFGTFIRSLNDVGFATKNAMMGLQNFAEAAKVVVNGHMKMLLKDIPVLKQLTTAGTKLKPEDIAGLHDMVFGKELDDLIRPSRADIIDKLRNQTDGATAVGLGSWKWATGEFANRNPFTWALQETSNLLLDAGRQGMIVDLAHHVLNGGESKLFTPERLRSASISDDQFHGIKGLIRDHFTKDADGKWSMVDKEGLADDARAMDLWRLGDRVADETILRPHKMSWQSSKQYGPVVGAAMQFKMFVLRSVNGRAMRGFWEATRNNQKLDQAMQAIVSVGLSGLFYAGSSWLKAQGLNDRSRGEYLRKALDPNMIAYQSLARSSHVGAPAGIASFIGGPFGADWATMARTSILPRDPVVKSGAGQPMKAGALLSSPAQDLMSNTAAQIPALGVLANAGMAAYSGAHVMANNRGDDIQGHRTALYQALKGFIYNDPLSQALMQKLAEDQGVNRIR